MAEERHICALLRQGCGGCPLLETPYPEQLRQKQSIAEYHRSKMELARAMSRLSEAGKRK